MFRTALLLVLLATPAFAEPRVDQHGDPLPDGAIVRFGTIRHRIGSARSVWSWAMSPDGKTLAVDSRHGITLWDIESGKPAHQFPMAGHPDESLEFGLQFSPDGKSIARLAGREVSVFDAVTGKERFSHDFKALGPARQMAFIANPPRLVITHEDLQKAHFLDAETGKLLKTLETEVPIWNLCTSGNYFLGWSQGVPAVPHLVDAKTGKVRSRFSEATATLNLECILSPDDRRLYAVHSDGRLLTFNAESGKLLETLTAPIDLNILLFGVHLSLSSDGNTAYLSSRGSKTVRRDLKEGKWIEPLPASFGGPVLTLPDSKSVLQVGGLGVLRRYDLSTLKQHPITDGFESDVFAYPSPDGLHIIASSSDLTGTRLDLFDISGKMQNVIHVKEYSFPQWLSDGKHLAGTIDRDVVILDSTTGRIVRKLRSENEQEAFSYARILPSEKQFIAVIGFGLAVATYDFLIGKRISSTPIGELALVHLAPDGRTLAFDSEHRGFALFDIENGRLCVDWTGLPEKGRRLSDNRALFSPDGSYLLTWEVYTKPPSSVEKNVAILRDPATLKESLAFEVDASGSFDCAFSPDGQWLAIGDNRGEIRLWDVPSRQEVRRWQGHRGCINSLHFASLGRVLTASDDLTALLWDLRPREKPKAALWDALSGKDASELYRATWAIADDPKGPELLRSKVDPAKLIPAERVTKLFADLGDNKFAVREAATKELEKIGRLMEADLRTARAKTTSEEVRTRLDALLKKITRERVGEEIVQARAVSAMELSGSDTAKKLLAEWAAGASGARLTIDAKAALARLNASR